MKDNNIHKRRTWYCDLIIWKRFPHFWSLTMARVKQFCVHHEVMRKLYLTEYHQFLYRNHVCVHELQTRVTCDYLSAFFLYNSLLYWQARTIKFTKSLCMKDVFTCITSHGFCICDIYCYSIGDNVLLFGSVRKFARKYYIFLSVIYQLTASNMY